jgi:GT2 family glycosyltransferase
MEDQVTLVITSCGRWNFLEETITSLFKTNTYPFAEIIIVDNSTDINASIHLQKIFEPHKTKTTLLLNKKNIGQVAAIDLAYKHVFTEYIFHTEDDWKYTGSSYIEKSLDVLKYDNFISNVNIRYRFDGEKGSDHPFNPLQKTSTGTEYHIYQQNYLGMWHGFSWNPGLRRLSDYKKIGGSYKKIGREQEVGEVYKNFGYYAACLKEQYAKHIGTNSITPLSNS